MCAILVMARSNITGSSGGKDRVKLERITKDCTSSDFKTWLLVVFNRVAALVFLQKKIVCLDCFARTEKEDGRK